MFVNDPRLHAKQEVAPPTDIKRNCQRQIKFSHHIYFDGHKKKKNVTIKISESEMYIPMGNGQPQPGEPRLTSQITT